MAKTIALFTACASIAIAHRLPYSGPSTGEQAADQGWSHGAGQHGGEPSHGEWAPIAGQNSICDRYTTSLFGENTYANQQQLIIVYVNTAMSGNYSPINEGITVTGVVHPAEWHGQEVNLMPYFNGELASTNLPKDIGHGVAVNWLDGGGVAALHANLSAYDRSSKQL